MNKFNIGFSPCDMTLEEANAVKEVLQSGWITTGPKTKELELKLSEYYGTNKTVCLNSATAALELTLRALGIGPGDEVITCAYTYTASASVIDHVGAKIVLIDSEKNNVFMDLKALEEAITEKTKVIIPIDIGGVSADYDEIFEICERKKHLFKASNEIQAAYNRVIIVADAAHSIGSLYKGRSIGNVADFTCFSFHAVKNLTTAEGGAVTWKLNSKIDDDELYKNYQLLSLHGQSKDALAKMKKGAWEYDILMPAYKCNMTDIMASIGLVQLKRYPELLNKRKHVMEKYNQGLCDLNVYLYQKEHMNSTNGHLYIIRLLNKDIEYRNGFIEKMAERGIACNVHYKPLPLLTAYKNLGFNIKDYPNAYHFYENEVTLPLHTLLTDEEVEYIIQSVKEILSE